MLYKIADREVSQIKPLQVLRGQATLYWNIPLVKLLQCGPLKYFNPREAVVRYLTNSHNKYEKKPPEVCRSPPYLLSGHPPGCLPPILSDLLPDRLKSGAGRYLSPIWRWRRPLGSGTHQERDRCPRVIHNNYPRRRQSHFKSRPTNGFEGPIINRQHRQ